MSASRGLFRSCRQIRTFASAGETTTTTPRPARKPRSVESDLLRVLSIPKARFAAKEKPSLAGNKKETMTETTSTPFKSSDMDKFRGEINTYYLHCLTSHSNTLLTLTNHKHEPVMWTSAGLCGFKKAARGGYEAGFRSLTTMLEKMRQKEEEDAALELKAQTEPSRVQKTQVKKQKPAFRPAKIELIIKDFGLGREAVMKAFMGVEGDFYRNRVTKIVDATPLKFGGVRARAVRRL